MIIRTSIKNDVPISIYKTVNVEDYYSILIGDHHLLMPKNLFKKLAKRMNEQADLDNIEVEAMNDYLANN